MSFLSAINQVKNQGYLRTLELLFNRFVPAWIFRYSKGDIFDFDIEKLKSVADSMSPEASDSLVAKCLIGTEQGESPDHKQRMRLRSFTWSSVPLESTANDLGYAIYDAQDPEKLLGGVWAAVGSFSEDNLGIDFKFGENQAWIYCAFVDSSARGRGVYKKLISFAANDLQQRGYSQLLGIVQPWNRISRIMHQQQSRGIIGTMSAIRILKYVWISHSGNLAVDKRMVINVKADPANVLIGTLGGVQVAMQRDENRTDSSSAVLTES